jgi:hypothetical protein
MTTNTTRKPFGPKLTTRRFTITAAVAGAAAAVGLLAAPAMAAGPSPASRVTASKPTIQINYRYHEVALANAAAVNAVEVEGQAAIPAGGNVTTTVLCPAGDVATGGGGDDLGNPGLVMFQDVPKPAPPGSGGIPDGWHMSWYNPTAAAAVGLTYAICAP